MMSQTPDILQRGGIALVFGMEWFPVLGNHPEGQARSLARRRGASHRVFTSGLAASVGLLRGRLSRRGGLRLCSAAAVFASLYPAGTVAAVVPLGGDRQWLVAVHEGAVMTRADKVHEDPSSVHDTVRLLREAHPGLILHDGSPVSSGLLDALFEAARGQGELIRAGGVAATPVAVLLGVMLLALSATALVSGRISLFGADPGAAERSIDPFAAWQGAVAASMQPHAVHGVAGMQALLGALHAVPVSVAGWLLAEVACRPWRSEWQCRARYRRSAAGDNQSFIAAARPGWAVSFDPMEGVDASWSVPMPAVPLGTVSLRHSRQNEIRLFSALQAMLPAFTELRLEAPQPLPLSVPLDAQQRPIPRPAGLAIHQRRAVRLQAPLRSLGLLLPEAVHMSWERVVLQVAGVDQPSLRSSSLRVSLSGVLYEIDGPDTSSSASSGLGAPGGVRDGGRGNGAGTNNGA